MEELQPKRVLSVVVILAIAFIFVINWGPGSRGCETGRRVNPENAYAARVNGKEIPLREFTEAYNGQVSQYRKQGLPEQVFRQFGVGKQLIEQLVNTELWSQAAEQHGIAPGDTELADLIRTNGDFQKDGQFDLAQYQDVLSNYYRKTVPEYEADLRRRLAAYKMQEVVSNTASVSEEEVKARFVKDGNKAKITYVRFLPAFYADKVQAATPTEVAAFKKDHGKESQTFYDANKALYDQPEKVRARHILIKVDRNAPAEAKAAAKQKLEALRKEIEGGKDFGQVAKDNSEDVGSKPSGGELGFNDRQAWVAEFSAAAFSLKPGEVSQPVETQFGYHLIQVEEKKAAEKKEFKDVEDQIATNLLKQEKAKDMAKADAEKALASATKGGKTLSELFPLEKGEQPAVKRFETEKKPEAVTTDEFNSSGSTLPNLGAVPELFSAIFATTGPKLLDKVYSVSDGWVVVAVADRKQPSDEAFAKEKDKLHAESLRAKQVEVRESFVKALKKDGKITINDEAINQVTERS